VSSSNCKAYQPADGTVASACCAQRAGCASAHAQCAALHNACAEAHPSFVLQSPIIGGFNHRRQAMISPERAARLARRHFALDGSATPLAGEVDHNFRIDTASGSYVLKVRPGGGDPDAASFVDAVLQHLAEHAPDVTAPRPVPAVDGRTTAIDESDGPPLLLRCLTWIDGTPWATSA